MNGSTITEDRIGTSSPNFSLMDFGEIYRRIQQEFRLWEIVMEGEHHPARIDPIVDELISSHPMNLQVHVPISDINIGSISEKLRQASVDEVLGALRFASDHDADPVTIHPGHFSPVTRGCLPLLTDRMARSLKRIDRAAEEYGVMVCLENMPNFPFAYCKHTQELLTAIEGTGFSLTFDIGHAMTNANMETFLTPEIIRQVGNVHIHDNHGTTDEHVTLGRGVIDLPSVVFEIERLGYRGTYIIESKSVESSVEGRDYLVQMVDLDADG